MESLITTFHIDWKIIIAQALNFLVVFLVLYFFALKPLKKMMSERENRINKGVEDAKINAETLIKTKKEYESVILKAKEEANILFQEGKKEVEVKKAEMMENAKKEVDALILNGKKVLESEKVKMVEEAKQEIVSLVVKATEKLLESQAGDKFDQKTVDQLKNI
ncbi:MAG: F0F1 ATP synthase subunit B [Candidatus Paceibacterota bacterium]|jgi:F-type H+-transporting ATPase subunit b